MKLRGAMAFTTAPRFRISAEQRQGTCCLLVETVEKGENALAHFVDRTASINNLKQILIGVVGCHGFGQFVVDL